MRYILLLATRYTNWKLATNLYPEHTPILLATDPGGGPVTFADKQVEVRGIEDFCATLRGNKVSADMLAPYSSANDQIVLVIDHAEPADLVKVTSALTGGYNGFHGAYTILEIRWDSDDRPRIIAQREHPLTWADAPASSLSAAAIRRLLFEADMAEIDEHNDAEAARYPNT